jgi:hypothetical protein
MAALSIDVVTIYTARSEAQLAADGAALAGARVLANSGMTSTTDALVAASAIALATKVATTIAQQNQIEGSPPTIVNVSIPASIQGNPHVTVQVGRNDLPTFFARIWGTKTLTVAASATAEAYNPAGGVNITASPTLPVAPTCVKPWLLPNLDPSGTSTGPLNEIFDPASGQTYPTGLLGYEVSGGAGLTPACGTCALPLPAPSKAPWQFYPGDPDIDFSPPNSTTVTCAGSGSFTPYQLSLAGCVQTPIQCNRQNVSVDLSGYGAARVADTTAAVNCLAHSTNNGGDYIVPNGNPTPAPFEFLAGAENPIVQSGAMNSGTQIMVSDSLVTVPVFDCGTCIVPLPSQQQNLVGFVQLFLNPEGTAAGGNISATVINLVGCGNAANGTPVNGNGPSAVPVRLITPP